MRAKTCYRQSWQNRRRFPFSIHVRLSVVVSPYVKFIHNNIYNMARVRFSYHLSRAFPRCSSRFGMAASQFLHAPLFRLHTIENPLFSGTRIQRISGKVFKSDNFCLRAASPSAGDVASKKNSKLKRIK